MQISATITQKTFFIISQLIFLINEHIWCLDQALRLIDITIKLLLKCQPFSIPFKIKGQGVL